jgi:sulfur relay protein TusB/DsrH
MDRILHILKEPDSALALDMIRQESQGPGEQVSVLLIQEAVAKPLNLDPKLKVYLLKEDLDERGIQLPPRPDYHLVNYSEMLDLIYEADKLVTW